MGAGERERAPCVFRYPEHVTDRRDNPFAALAGLRDALPKRAGGRASDDAPARPEPKSPFAGKVVVSKSRKGRGGRTVTIVSGLRTDDAGRDALCRELKRALGCGASVEGDTLVVSGDIGDRIARWLEAKGAKKVVIGA